MAPEAITELVLGDSLKLEARGKVRNLYDINDSTLLFVATDRISAFDVVMKSGIPQKGVLLTLMTLHWFQILSESIPDLRTHFISLEIPAQIPENLKLQLQDRSMQVHKLEIFPLEVIVRGYITGSAWSEYKKSGSLHGMKMPEGLQECGPLPNGAMYTPSTKAPMGEKDENIHPDQATKILVGKYGEEKGQQYAKRIEELALRLYKTGRDYAAKRGIIIADTKFEFGLDKSTDEVVLVDEVLTPDSSRFWPAASYKVGQAQDSLDKQPLREFLISNNLKGKEDLELPERVILDTQKRYKDAYEMLVEKKLDA